MESKRTAAQVLADIADAFDANALDNEARKFWGVDLQHENKEDPDTILLYQGRGGKTLLTLGDCFRAREELKDLRRAKFDGRRPQPRKPTLTPLPDDIARTTDFAGKQIDDYPDCSNGLLMTYEEFAEDARCGSLKDYDGFGEYATETHYWDGGPAISPSDLVFEPVQVRFGLRADFTHVLWYNR